MGSPLPNAGTLLIASIYGSSQAELRRQMAEAIEQGADALELRLDLCEGLTDDDLRQIAEDAHPPLILTIRSATEGGGWDGKDDDRVSRLIELGPIAGLIDVELELWRRSANVRQKIGLALHRKEDLAMARRLLLSKHDQTTRPASLHKDFLDMIDTRKCSVPKIAYRARTVRDNFEAFDLMRTSPKRPIAICMGPDGAPSRILAKKFSAFGTFASLSNDRTTAPGQLSIETLKLVYRWDSIGPHTSVYGLIGNPIAHSLSPRIHNHAFTFTGTDAVYVPFRVDDSYESFKAFMVEVVDRPWLDLRGLSITVPHKENAIRFAIERGSDVDDVARRIGSANTFKFDATGRLSAFNTDAPAFADEMLDLCRSDAKGLRGKSAAILGAGGMARAAIRSLLDFEMTVTVYNRTDQRAGSLATSMGCNWRPWQDRLTDSSALLINCTSAGSNDEGSLLPPASVTNHSFIFDAQYRSDETRLVRDASAAGISARGGLGMLLRQAARQFYIWTGHQLTCEQLKEALP
ncbi:MAG TPA: type I 3-dehydroquinate dehydratase [Phycisphaerae bacterium]|nr:type I 3-dehydroquinate dehydratase [Phycisphaerae bacterium]